MNTLEITTAVVVKGRNKFKAAKFEQHNGETLMLWLWEKGVKEFETDQWLKVIGTYNKEKQTVTDAQGNIYDLGSRKGWAVRKYEMTDQTIEARCFAAYIKKYTTTVNNFHSITRANFTRVDSSLVDGLTPFFESKSGSSYWVVEVAGQTCIVRKSNHWLNRVRSCSWLLDGKEVLNGVNLEGVHNSSEYNSCESKALDLGEIEEYGICPIAAFQSKCSYADYRTHYLRYFAKIK